MPEQSGPVLSCTYSKHVVFLDLRPKIATDPDRTAMIRRMVLAAYPPVTPCDTHESTLAFNTERMGREDSYFAAVTPEQLNRSLLAQEGCHVLRVTKGATPMTILVAVKFRPHREHMKYVLQCSQKYGVVHVHRSSIEAYNGQVLELFVPFDTSPFDFLENTVREALTFSLDS